MNQALPARAKFHHMKDGTAEDWAIIGGEAKAFAATVYERIMDHLKLLSGDCGGFPVDRLTPCLLYTSPSPRDLSTSRMPSSA